METPSAQLEIDWTRCDGHGMCAELLPDQINRDHWGFPLIRSHVTDERRARRAVALCPALALRLSAGGRDARAT